jgi:hypothetical protein
MYGLHAGREKALANLQAESVVNLTGLNCRDEDLEGLPGMPRLNRLHLRGRFVTDKTLRAAAHAHGLIELYLESTAVTDRGLEQFHAEAWLPDSPEITAAREAAELPAPLADLAASAKPADPATPPHEINDLKFLHIESSPITDAGLAHLAAFTRLERLSLHKTKITGAGLSAIAALPLLSLSLEGRAIDDAGANPIAALRPTLTRLELFDTAMTDPSLRTLGELENLERLNLTGAPVTDQGLTHLKNLHKLQYLTLRGTKATAAGVTALNAALPACQISL